MRGPRLGNWLDRPGYVALVAFVAGAGIAGIVVAVILMRGGSNNGSARAQTTTTPRSTGARTPLATGTAITPTATPGRFRKPADALAAYVQEQLHQTYLGPCPPGPTGQTPLQGICSKSLYESDQLATYILGPPLSEGIGEAVLTVASDGTWSVDVVQVGPVGKSITVGAETVAFGAGDCLRFHAEASQSSQTQSCQLDGTKARVTDGPVQAGGKTWWKLENFGWASSEFLQPAQ